MAKESITYEKMAFEVGCDSSVGTKPQANQRLYSVYTCVYTTVRVVNK